MLPLALNQMTVPTLSVQAVFDLARQTGCMGVELRNDLGRPLFDGQAPEKVAELAAEYSICILALAEINAFNDAPNTKASTARALMQTAQACGAEGIALIPQVLNAPIDRAAQRSALRHALTIYQPMLTDMGLIGYIEPLGFTSSSLRHKDDVATVLTEIDAPACFKIVHDTFHHHLSGDTSLHADLTGLVHISGVSDPTPVTSDMTDAHRILVDADDRLENITQLQALAAQGYNGPTSFECFAPHVHDMTDPATEIAGSIAFITSHMTAKAA